MQVHSGVLYKHLYGYFVPSEMVLYTGVPAVESSQIDQHIHYTTIVKDIKYP